MKTLFSLFAIPVIAFGSVMLVSAIGGKSAIQQIQELHGAAPVEDSGDKE